MRSFDHKINFVLIAGPLLIIAILVGMVLLDYHRPNATKASITELIQWLGGDYRWLAGAKELIRRGRNDFVITELRESLTNSNPKIATGAEYVLFRLGDEADERFQSLVARVTSNDLTLAPGRAGLYLGNCLEPQDAKYAPVLVRTFEEVSDSDPWIKSILIRAISHMPEAPGVVQFLRDRAKDPSEVVRQELSVALGTVIETRQGVIIAQWIIDTFRMLAFDRESDVRFQAIKTLREYRSYPAVNELLLEIAESGISQDDRDNARS